MLHPQKKLTIIFRNPFEEKLLHQILTELKTLRPLVTKGVRYLATIAGEIQADDNVAVSAHLTVETGPEGR